MGAVADPGAELVEEVDERGRVVRVVTRATMRAENLRHRNIGVVVRRPTGAVVVHRRADWKDVHPSLWDIVFGGVPAVGEDDADAAVRELAEEAGLVVDAADLEELCRGPWATTSTPAGWGASSWRRPTRS